jgi:hypothetical protein
MVWIKVNQTQLAVDSLQLPQNLFLKGNYLLVQTWLSRRLERSTPGIPTRSTPLYIFHAENFEEAGPEHTKGSDNVSLLPLFNLPKRFYCSTLFTL